MAQVHLAVNQYANENESMRRMKAAPARSVAARSSALFVVALALCAQQSVATSMTDAHSLRGKNHVVHGHHHRHAAAPVPDADASSAEAVQVQAPADPLYNDFLALVNQAAGKALEEKEKDGAPAFDDFLHVMKKGADKAYKQQTGTPDYDEFLGFLKVKVDDAYHEQVELPSYDDFLVALKTSTSKALKQPDPSFEDFLSTLAEGSEKAMQQRVFSELKPETVNALQAKYEKVTKKVGNPLNPFQQAGKDVDDDAIEMKVENPFASKEKDDDDNLRNELRHLKNKQKEQEDEHAETSGGVPHRLKKPVMARINVLRTQLCWKRPNLWQHKKCLRFLGLHCMEQSTGEGICKAFAKKSKEKCETSTADEKMKEDYCALSEALTDDDKDEDEDEDVEEGDADEVIAKGKDDASEGGDGAGKGKSNDRDGDGVIDSEDDFADDASESKDTDGDGIGDNVDQDIDGDGVNNDEDAFPADKTEWKDTDHDGIGDNVDKDKDGDNLANEKDKFPTDPTEWKDSDGDGVGDNKDAHPYNPNCHSATEPCDDISETGAPKPGSPEDPASLDMSAQRKLPEQGFSEHSSGAPVNHDNYYTYVGDWQEEFPEMPESEKQTMARICKEHSKNIWCTRFANQDAHFR